MPDTQGHGLWQLFAHQLKQYQYRTFTNNKIIITIYKDNELMKTASTLFKIDKPNPHVITPNEALQTNVQPSTMQLSDVGIQMLSQLPKEDLEKLASTLGKSSSLICYYIY